MDLMRSSLAFDLVSSCATSVASLRFFFKSMRWTSYSGNKAVDPILLESEDSFPLFRMLF